MAYEKRLKSVQLGLYMFNYMILAGKSSQTWKSNITQISGTTSFDASSISKFNSVGHQKLECPRPYQAEDTEDFMRLGIFTHNIFTQLSSIKKKIKNQTQVSEKITIKLLASSLIKSKLEDTAGLCNSRLIPCCPSQGTAGQHQSSSTGSKAVH